VTRQSSTVESLNINLPREATAVGLNGRKLSSRIRDLFRSALPPRIHLFGRVWPAFQVLGVAAFLSASVLTIGLASVCGLSAALMAIIAVISLGSIFGLAMSFKVLTGKERYVYYHHAALVVLLCALLTWMLGLPTLRYLDLTVLGIGQFLWLGRIGCLMVGCCYGRPCRWGIRYSSIHADEGFPYSLVGVRLFPSQIVEALFVLIIVAIGTFMFMANFPAGAVLSWYVIAYSGGRMLLEFFRGDPERPYLWGYSEPQWTSLFVLSIVVFCEIGGVLPLQRWHLVLAVLPVLTMVGIGIWRRFQPTMLRLITSAPHTVEVAEAVEFVTREAIESAGSDSSSSFGPQRVQIAYTTFGLQISAGRIPTANQPTYHYALSQRDGQMTEENAKAVASLIRKLLGAEFQGQLVSGSNGVFHMLLPEREVFRS
jgi:hypothetical protein